MFFWFLGADINSNLEKRCKEYVLQTGMFDYMGSEDWYLLQRAGLASRRARQRLEAESQSLTGACSTTHARGCFFIDVSILHRTLVVPIGLGTWREDVRRRLKTTDLPKGLQEQLALAEWRFDGKRLADGTPGTKLVDGIARLDVPVLRGGMAPKKQYNQMKEKDLRKLCSKDTIARHRKDASGKLIQKSKDELVADLEAWDLKQSMVQATCEAGGASASTLGGMFSSQRAKQKVKEEVKEEEATASSQSTFQPLAESVHMTLDETLPAVAHESVRCTAVEEAQSVVPRDSMGRSGS